MAASVKDQKKQQAHEGDRVLEKYILAAIVWSYCLLEKHGPLKSEASNSWALSKISWTSHYSAETELVDNLGQQEGKYGRFYAGVGTSRNSLCYLKKIAGRCRLLNQTLHTGEKGRWDENENWEFTRGKNASAFADIGFEFWDRIGRWPLSTVSVGRHTY